MKKFKLLNLFLKNTEGKLSSTKRGGFTFLEVVVVITIVLLLSAISVPYLRNFISSQRLQEVAWLMEQDLKTTRESAILYQQDLNFYINYNNSPVESNNPSNLNNRSYYFETFQWGKDQNPQVEDSHYIPGDSTNKHFVQRTLKYGIIIDSMFSINSSSPSISSQINFSGKNYYVVCFRSGAGNTFRGECDVVTSMNLRKNTSTQIIDKNKLIIKLKDPSTNKAFYVTIEATGKVSTYGSPPQY